MMKPLKYENGNDLRSEEKEKIKEAVLRVGIERFREEVQLLTSVNGVSIFDSIVFMALQNISKKWTMPIRDWNSAINLRFCMATGCRYESSRLHKKYYRLSFSGDPKYKMYLYY
jgi:hypothetical protein